MKFTTYAEVMRFLQVGEEQQQILLQLAEKRQDKEIHNSEVSQEKPQAKSAYALSLASTRSYTFLTCRDENPRRLETMPLVELTQEPKVRRKTWNWSILSLTEQISHMALATCVASKAITQRNVAGLWEHISLHIFGYTHELTDTGQVEIQKVAFVENIANVSIKALAALQHPKLVAAVGMKTLAELSSKWWCYSFSSFWSFFDENGHPSKKSVDIDDNSLTPWWL